MLKRLVYLFKQTITIFIAFFYLIYNLDAQNEDPEIKSKIKKIDKNVDQLPFLEAVQKIYSFQILKISKDKLIENLLKKYLKPLDLNTCSKEKLFELGILTEKEIAELFDYTIKNGKLFSINEIQVLPSFSIEKIRLLKTFTKVKNEKTNYFQKNPLKSISNSYFLIRYKQEINTNENQDKNLGGPNSLLIKSKIQSPNYFKLGYIVQKSIREQFIWDPSTSRYLFNHYSGSFEINNIFILRSFIVGDYEFGCGQGLITSESFFLGKFFDYAFIDRNQMGLRSYQTIQKNKILTGIASTIKFDEIELTYLFSAINQDTNFNIQDGQTFANTIENNFKYDTEKKLFSRNMLNEKIAGINLTYKHEETNNQTGLTFLYRKFCTPILSKKTPSYYEHQLQGSRNINFSWNGKCFWKNLLLFSEIGYSNIEYLKEKQETQPDNLGLIIGSMVALNKEIDLAILGRYYGADFHAIRGNSFRQNTENRNEKGIYFSIKYQPYYKIIINPFLDLFWFHKPKYRIPLPSKGIEFGSKIEFLPTKTHSFIIKNKNNIKDKKKDNEIYKYYNIKSSIDYKWDVTMKFALKTQIKMMNVFFQEKNKNYFLIAQNIIYKFKLISFKGQIALFNSGAIKEESFYVCENKLYLDAPKQISYSNFGLKAYLLTTYRPFNPFRIEIKYEILNHSSKKTNYEYLLRHDINLQLSYSF